MSTPVLDVTAGSRMMWFDKTDSRATFGDIRCETLTACDGRSIVVDPDVLLDFRHLPYPNEVFDLVVFDPPQLTPVRPLFGDLTSKQTHWCVFMKSEVS